MRAEYTRSDFARLERGKFYKDAAEGTSVALLHPMVAKAFPTSEAVNEALLGLLALTEQTARIPGRPKLPPRKREPFSDKTVDLGLRLDDKEACGCPSFFIEAPQREVIRHLPSASP